MEDLGQKLIDYLPEIIGGVILAALGIWGQHWLSKKKRKTDGERTNEAAEAVVLELLRDKRFPMRKFTTIKSRLGGLSDDQIRQVLLRVGAVKFKGEDEVELWGLKSRNKDKVLPNIESMDW